MKLECVRWRRLQALPSTKLCDAPGISLSSTELTLLIVKTKNDRTGGVVFSYSDWEFHFAINSRTG